MLLTCLRQISFPNPKIVSIFYIIYSSVLSIIFNYVHLPDSFFNQRTNFLNVYFMKYSYIYATVVLLPFAYILHYLLNCGDWKKSMFSFLRIFIFAFVNYCIGEEFNVLGFFYGMCDMYAYVIDDRTECISSGYKWARLDISGHVFHIVYSILVVLEEISFLRNWKAIEEKIADESVLGTLVCDDNPITEISREKFSTFQVLFRKLNPFINFFFVILALLMIFLHFSIFITLIYFHTVFEKIVASIVAVSFWFITYYLIYPISGFKTRPYQITTAEHDNLLEKSNEFNLISDKMIDFTPRSKNNSFFSLFNRNSDTYEIL